MTTETVLDKIQSYRWPEDKAKIAKLSTLEIQLWVSYQNPQALIWLGQLPEYKRFMLIHYIWPTKIQRLGYKLKRWAKYLAIDGVDG